MRLAEADARIDGEAVNAGCRPLRGCDAGFEIVENIQRHIVDSADRPASSCGSPWACIRTTDSPWPGGREARRVVGKRRDVVDDLRPGFAAARAHAGACACRRRGPRSRRPAPDHGLARALLAAQGRYRSRAASILRRHRESAPASASAAAYARWRRRTGQQSPPSEKLSGVTLTIPISSGRSREAPQSAARGRADALKLGGQDPHPRLRRAS